MARNLVPLADVPNHRHHATVRQLRRQVAERRIGFYKLDGRVLIDLDEYDAYVEHGRVDPAKPVTLRSIQSSRRRAS